LQGRRDEHLLIWTLYPVHGITLGRIASK